MQEQSEPLRVISRKHQKLAGIAAFSKQHGAALILIVFIIALGVTAVMIKSFNATSMKAEQDANTMQSLAQAREALIGWSVSHSTTPGQLPWPDRRETTTPNYDGQSDCSSANFNLINSLSEPNFLGQIPTITSTNPCQGYPGVGNRFQDSSGSNLWYAVSRNLVRSYAPPADPVINPRIINDPDYPWMIVRNSVGAIVSDRVAVVIIAPGLPLSGQDRSTNAPLPINFLDQITIGATTYRNYDYDNDDEDFIMGETTSGNFNDKLVYITIDELMASIEKRVGEVSKFSLNEYKATNGYLPYASQLGTVVNFTPEEGILSGFLPVHFQSCSYRRSGFAIGPLVFNPRTYIENCNQPIFDVEQSGISTIQFTSTNNAFISEIGGCTRTPNNQNCTCTAAGSCSGNNGFIFECTEDDCEAQSNTFNDSAWGVLTVNGGKFTHRTGNCIQTSAPTKTTGCTNSDSVISCSGEDAGTFSSSSDEPFNSYIPSWFTTNDWQSYVYYQINRGGSGSLTAGDKQNLDAVIITMGKSIEKLPFSSKGSAQIRPSCDTLDHYLDSAENADADTIFDAIATRRNEGYNDQIFTITP